MREPIRQGREGASAAIGLRQSHADQHGCELVGFELQGRGGAKSRVERYQQPWLCGTKVEELKELEALVKLIKEPGDPEDLLDGHEHPEAYLADQAYIDSLFAPGVRR